MAARPGPIFPSTIAVGWWGGFLALALTSGTPATAHSTPGGDDWSLQRRKDDPQLIGQRLAKLQRDPFDDAQWQALERLLGAERLGQRIDAALAKDPQDVALRILDARAKMAQGALEEAVDRLQAIEPNAGRWGDRVFSLRVRALHHAGRSDAAIDALERKAEERTSSERLAYLRRALELAQQTRAEAAAVRLAKRLVVLDPDSVDHHLDLARAATATGDASVADASYARAADLAGGPDKIVAERAHSRLSLGNASGAADMLWSLLSDASRGTRTQRDQWWEWLTDAHRRTGSAEMLTVRLRGWIEQHRSREPAAWRALAGAQETSGASAIESWQEVIEIAPADLEARIALLEALETAGRTAEAVDQLRILLRRAPEKADHALDFANRLVANGQRELAMSIALDIERRAGRSAQILLTLLDFYNLNDESERALEVAHRLVRGHPRDPDARIALGEQLYQMNQVDEAMAQWAKLPGLIRPRERGLARHAEVLSEHGRTHEAIRVLKSAIELSPEQPHYLRLMAVLKEENQRHAVALGYWESVRQLASDPKDRVLRDEARTRLVELLVSGGGDVPQRHRKLQVAIAKARRELDAGEPRDQALEAGRFLAELHTRSEDYAAAVAVQERLLQLAPDATDRLVELAAAQRRAGQTREAMATLETLLARTPGQDAEVLAQLSELAYEAGQPERALETATLAVQQDRGQIQALLRLGELHERQGDLSHAAQAYRRALSAAPGDGRARLRLAELTLTQGEVGDSAAMFRQILMAGGTPQVMREAGRRALDLAEATSTTSELVALAIERSRAQPDADEPREFLLETLERARAGDVEVWLRNGKQDGPRVGPRVTVLRRPLVASLTRGSVGARLRAAEHLGRLGLPDTAVPLAKMGAQLSAPRDATRTIRDAFEQARVTALVAAGELDDPRAVGVFDELLSDPNESRETRYAAAWALTRSSAPEALRVLAPLARADEDPLLGALACIAIATAPAGAATAQDIGRAELLARSTEDLHVRHACIFATAASTPEHELIGLLPHLESSDPVEAAIVAWRLGHIDSRPSDAVIEALLRRFIGPNGLVRDAAGAALARLLQKNYEAPDPSGLPPVHAESWTSVVERWLKSTVAPRFRPIAPAALDPHRDALEAALQAAKAGTRAEQAAFDRVLGSCEGTPARRTGATSLCLVPLVSGSLRLPDAPAD